jgi:hypothetical protein
MSAHSTINLTREAALEFALPRIAVLSDEDLSRVMNVLLDEYLKNCRIVSDWAENDNQDLDRFSL